jgi:hypothetical protein
VTDRNAPDWRRQQGLDLFFRLASIEFEQLRFDGTYRLGLKRQ